MKMLSTEMAPRESLVASWLPWLGLGVAVSPVLASMAETFWRAPHSRPALLAAVLLAFALARTGAPSVPAHRDGGVGLALGLLMVVFGLAGETEFVARLGIPVAALGLARLAGRPDARTAALLFFAVPVPATLLMLVSPALELQLGRLALLAANGLGASLELSGRTWVGTAGRLELTPPDNGLPLVPMLAGLGWYAGLRAAGDLRTCATRALAFGVITIPLQLAGLVVAACLLWAGSPDAGHVWLSRGLWLTIAVAGLVWIERQGPRSSTVSHGGAN